MPYYTFFDIYNAFSLGYPYNYFKVKKMIFFLVLADILSKCKPHLTSEQTYDN